MLFVTLKGRVEVGRRLRLLGHQNQMLMRESGLRSVKRHFCTEFRKNGWGSSRKREFVAQWETSRSIEPEELSCLLSIYFQLAYKI